MPVIENPAASETQDAAIDRANVRVQIPRGHHRQTSEPELTGWGEMVVALATIGTLLLTVWILVALGVLEGGAAPTLPDEFQDLEVQDAGGDTSDSDPAS